MLSEILADLRYRLRALFHRDAVERELDDELRFHIEREAQRYERVGVPPDEAQRRARVAFGGVERAKEESRDNRGTRFVETAFQDLHYALRGLRTKPGFTLGVVLTLGLGIGANAAMFGIVDRLLFRAPAFLHDPAGVHRVYLSYLFNGNERTERNMEFARYLDFINMTSSFDRFAAFQTRQLAVGSGEQSREMSVAVVSASFFGFFDAPPALGRYFTADEDRIPEGAPVVVLSYPFWQTQFGGRRDILGSRIRIDRMTCTVVGVAPEGFVGVGDRQVPAAYVPITAYAFSFRGPNYPKGYTWNWMELLARRSPGVSHERATAELTAAFHRSWLADPQSARLDIKAARPRAILAPIQFDRGPQATAESKVATWVSGVALIVLLIACANVANLLLSRAVKRRREIALRLALGVSRGRLVRQLLTEALLLAAFGGAAGLATAQWGGAVLRSLFSLDDSGAKVLTDGRTLAVALLATVAAALLTGLVPALQGSRADLARALNAGGRDAGLARSRTRTGLLLIQATLSVVLLVGAGLFVRSLQHVRSMRLGYDVEPVVFVAATTRGVKLTKTEEMALDARLVEEARRVPGVTNASMSASVPFYSNEGRPLFVAGIDTVRKRGRFILQAGAPELFATLGTRIVRGRSFTAEDRLDAPRVVVVSEGMAKALWPAEEPIGKCIRINADTVPCTTVIGVAEEMRMRTLKDDREFSYYIPIAQYDNAAGYIYVRVAGDASDYVESVRRRLQRLMSGASYVTAMPLSKLVDPNMRSWQFGATMFVAFGALALVLAAIGLYSVIAYNVAQRRQEIGVRIALGASRGNVMRLVLGSGLRLVIVGVAIGAAIALWAGRWVESLLFDQSPRDPAVFAAVATVLVAVALVASAVPALGASRVDPNVALRAD